MRTVSFFTLGCRLNQSESAVLEGAFLEKGCRVVPFDQPADVAVINSCTVTAAGDSDARYAVNKAVRINPAVEVAVIGCQAQVQKDKILSWPNVRWVVGTAKKMDLAELVLSDIEMSSDVKVLVPPIRRVTFELPVSKVLPISDRSRTRASVKIQDGCDHFCAYCEIPYARGRSRSRAFNNVIQEAQALATAGYKELIITGVNVGDYADQGLGLVDIVSAVENIRGIERVRISSIEHTKLPLDLVGWMKPPHKLCRFLHIPVQSACDRTLRRMGRGYTAQDIEQLAQSLISSVDQMMLGTDIIVGFPGETEADFDATREFLARSPFGYFHVFSYSHRQKARSRLFKGTVPDSEIARRREVLRHLSDLKRREFHNSLLGTTQMVLFEYQKDNHWFGHTDNYATIKVRSAVKLKNELLPVRLLHLDGEFVTGHV